MVAYYSLLLSKGTGEIFIGKKIKLINFAFTFEIGLTGPSAGGSTQFELDEKLGGFAC